ncbi:MAG: class II aldolase/adducin family protein, partial [Desulfomonilia bacterium]|nr:class II aldolase/adducin family protein [Desulfomonilia bacterium]
ILSISSLVHARPGRDLWRIITALCDESLLLITPRDSESLTFIHDIPVVDTFDPDQIACALNRRKGCIVRDSGLVTVGSVSVEQAFIVLSSICFACFVKFFSDLVNGLGGFGSSSRPDRARIEVALELLGGFRPPTGINDLPAWIPDTEEGIVHAMDITGKLMVTRRLVDSFFGNISCLKGNDLYISQTGSSLDELPGYIDRVPLDGSSTCDLTSSSELMAHLRIYELTSGRVIIHGHPKFSVIMSMVGGELPFGQRRSVAGIPVVSGEVGAGRRGLMHTLPEAMVERGAAIVSGHGTFCSNAASFSNAFETLSDIEHRCYEAFFEELRIKGIEVP